MGQLLMIVGVLLFGAGAIQTFSKGGKTGGPAPTPTPAPAPVPQPGPADRPAPNPEPAKPAA